MRRSDPIPVIDLFAGPGGLAEGFSAFTDDSNRERFKIALSIEKDPIAHQTLTLRNFFRQFPRGDVPDRYYHRLQQQITTQELFDEFPDQSHAAQQESWRAALGNDIEAPIFEVRRRIREALRRFPDGEDRWILIGGPPCQAYSLAGRSRNKGKEDYRLDDDPKARLYLEYLQMIADFWPAIFVMENVRGLLSARMDGGLIFDQIAADLSQPAEALQREKRGRTSSRKRTYTLRAVTSGGLFRSPGDFLVRSERFGIPQARHRVIIVGVRDDLDPNALGLLQEKPAPTVGQMITDLPRIRSGLSRAEDNVEAWIEALGEVVKHVMPTDVLRTVRSTLRNRDSLQSLDRGDEYCSGMPCVQVQRPWFVDNRVGGFCNHSARGHIRSDLHRYLFASSFAQVKGYSPELGEFPETLHPNHQNVGFALLGSHFADRFRVQVCARPSTTITSHISKDGHYYIHYDPSQCRSLTVREAARLQTFPDNYFFEGPRTAQYIQVGNAVPPLLARQIAALVNGPMRGAQSTD